MSAHRYQKKEKKIRYEEHILFITNSKVVYFYSAYYVGVVDKF
jgi:hypothetical protein